MSQARLSRIGQVRIYTGKCFRVFQNEKGWKNFIGAAIIAIIISGVIGREMWEAPDVTIRGAFALICACIWIGIFNSIQSICRERAIIKREHRTGLHISSYITAHMIYEMALCFVEAFITVIIVGIIRGFPDGGIFLPSFLELFITFFLVIFAADALGLLVSCIVKKENTAMTVMPFVLIIQLVMSGFLFPLEGIMSAVANVTISKWGLNAICSTADINRMLKFLGQPFRPEYTFSTPNITQLWLILIGFVFLYGILGIIVLKLFIDKDKR